MTFPDRIYNIGEDEFWRHLRVPEKTTGAEQLAEVIRLGLAGEKDRAYAELAGFHRAARTHSWEKARETAAKSAPLSADEITEIIGEAVAPEIIGLQRLSGRVTPLVMHLIHRGTAAPDWRRFLADVLVACYRHRKKLAQDAVYPLNSQLPAHGHFHFFWHIYLLLAHTGEVPTEAAEGALKLIMGLGRAMSEQSKRYIVHNIFTAGCFGLFFLARTMTEFSEAPDWDKLALKQLDTDFDRSFFPDGGHLERNWGYGAHTLWRLGLAYHFAAETGGMRGREKHYFEGMQRAYRFYAKTLGPNELCPAFGDEGMDGQESMLDQARRSGFFPPDAPRDLGVDRRKSYLMEGARVAVMRNGAGKEDAYLNLSYGDFAGWHSHQDLLSMNLRAKGEVLLEEVPRFGPYEHPLDLVWRQSEAHNLLLVDGFHYDCRPVAGEDAAWYSDEHVDYFSAYHRAYRTVPSNEHRDYLASGDLIVRRTVVFVKDPGYALALDSVRPEDSENFNRATSCRWHSPHGFSILGPGLVRTNGSTACLLAFARPETLQRLETGLDFNAEDLGKGFNRVPYDQWHHLRARTWMPVGYQGCLGFAAVLYPFTNEVPELSLKPIPLRGQVMYRAEAFAVETPNGQDIFVLNPEKLPGVALADQPVPGRAAIKLADGKRQIDIA